MGRQFLSAYRYKPLKEGHNPQLFWHPFCSPLNVMKLLGLRANPKVLISFVSNRSAYAALLGLPVSTFVGIYWFWQVGDLERAVLASLVPKSQVVEASLAGHLEEFAGLLKSRNPAFTPAPEPPPKDFLSVPTAGFLPPPPALKEEERLQLVRREQILDDPLDRISEDFRVPESLRERTEFWFDVYTKYGSNHHVIHHGRYPWIVYAVVDLESEISSGKGPLWLRTERARKQVSVRRGEIRRALNRLASLKSFKKLKPLEQQLYAQLSSVKGKRSRVFREAAISIRSQLGQRDFFIEGLRRSTQYLPYMEEIFNRSGLPVELTRMPFVESSFNEMAESKVGASGIWQIMPYTGRAYFQVNDRIDERNSPLKATGVAGSLLRSYYRSLGSWPLAITSYNHGIGNIQQAIRAARSRDLPTIIERYHKGDFKFASSNFFTCFLAALYAERYSELTFPSVARQPLIEIEQVRVTKNIPMKMIRDASGLNEETLIKFNQDLRHAKLSRLILPAGYIMHLPPGHAQELSQKLRARLQFSPTPLPARLSERPIKPLQTSADSI